MKKIFLILVMTLSVFVSRAQQISVNTDVTMLMMQVYNAGAEMTIGNRSTLGLSVLGTKNPYIKKDMKLVAIQPEYRYYFGGRPLYHHFVGLGLLAADYNFVQKGKRYDGYALGAGLTFGYVFATYKLYEDLFRWFNYLCEWYDTPDGRRFRWNAIDTDENWCFTLLHTVVK